MKKNKGKYRYIRITKLQQEEAEGRVIELIVKQVKEAVHAKITSSIR